MEGAGSDGQDDDALQAYGEAGRDEAGLYGSSKGLRIRFSKGKLTVTAWMR